MDITRFDDRRTIAAIIGELIAHGMELDDLDVRLSRFGPVDLDLLGECLAEALRPLPAGAAQDAWSRAAA